MADAVYVGTVYVDFAVSITPKTKVGEITLGNVETYTINEEVKKSLGGSGTLTIGAVSTTAPNFTGYADGVSTPMYDGDGGTFTKFLFAKNTGLLSTGVASTAYMIITIGSDTTCYLYPGEAIMLPGSGSSQIFAVSMNAADVGVEILAI